MSALVVAVCVCAFASTAEAFDTKRKDVKAFIAEMAQKNGFKRKDLETLLTEAKSQPAILEAISRPAERVLPWFEYRSRFITEKRIGQGVEFRKTHEELLKQIDRMGVSSDVVTGILGVETSYGANIGKYRVIDALATLAFDYPPRAEFFRSELAQFLLLTREESLDPLTPMGSYAGAMGLPQFMPSSYRKFAVDGDQDQRRDLWTNWDDTVLSVANFLLQHGWHNGEPIAVPATVSDASKFDTTTLALNETVESLQAKGVKFETDMPPGAPVMLIAGQGKEGMEYRVGFNNFFVITRYNRSPLYAMAVNDLGVAIDGALTSTSNPCCKVASQ
jgi:membrane-bound lytic murein transglycosylase B